MHTTFEVVFQAPKQKNYKEKVYIIRKPKNLVQIFHQCSCALCDCMEYEYTPHKFKLQMRFTNFSAEKLSSRQLPLISTLCADS